MAAEQTTGHSDHLHATGSGGKTPTTGTGTGTSMTSVVELRGAGVGVTLKHDDMQVTKERVISIHLEMSGNRL